MKTGVKVGLTILSILTMCPSNFAQLWLWTSPQELENKPMSGPAWSTLISGADENTSNPDVANQDDNTNAHVLAAAIVFARTGNEHYKNKVIAACEQLVRKGHPGGRTLAWGRETGAYALAADLVEYRTPAFEEWLHNMVDVWKGSARNETLREMFKARPNNWGTQGFGSLCAVYAYLQDTTRLNEIRDYWMQSVVGPKPAQLQYGDDWSWHADENNLRLINPKGAMKQGLNIDGIVPDDMRRGGPFQIPPKHTGYAWETLQGMVSGARILERVGMSIWAAADSAIYRAVYALQVRWQNEFGGWKAEGDDLWMLPFVDNAYGTNWSEGQETRVWDHGKNAGWGYVVWEPSTVNVKDTKGTSTPKSNNLFQNYPNPFNQTTIINYSLQESGYVQIVIYDLRGRTVITMVEGFQNQGTYSHIWDTVAANGAQLPSGIYLARIQVGAYEKTIKMIALR